MWGGLSARQRVLAAVLIAIVFAAGIYRWVHFGNVNRVRGGGSSPTMHTLIGEGEVFPTTAEVEEDARNEARGEGRPSKVSCHEVPGSTWTCMVHFVGGLIVFYRGVWYESRKTVGFSVVRRTATVHFRVPIR
jgi:hypothetical protein